MAKPKAPASTEGCPLCGKPAAAPHRPFCSRRCTELDLGRWLGGRYRIPSDEGPGEAPDDGAGEPLDEGAEP